jgi:hypothetical protein
MNGNNISFGMTKPHYQNAPSIKKIENKSELVLYS